MCGDAVSQDKLARSAGAEAVPDVTCGQSGDIPVIYVTCSPFSGSTLLSLLLNTHANITTAGHTTGWAGLTDDFPCSCGAPIKACPFFSAIAGAFSEAGLSLAFQGHFPTCYTLGTRFARLDQLIFENLPKFGATRLERWRDVAVRHTPPLRGRVAAVNRANVIFMRAALNYTGAQVYVDNSHSPYRCQRLSGVSGLNVFPVHLVRDVRGAALSAAEIYGWSVEFAALHWIRVQEQIVRVFKSTPRLLPKSKPYSHLVVSYEDLCNQTERSLARITDRVGLSPPEEIGDFKAFEHHILGNEMRFGSGKIAQSQRWRTELSRAAKLRVEDQCRAYATESIHAPELEAILEPMLGD